METDVKEPMIVKGVVTSVVNGTENGMESPKTVLLDPIEVEEVDEEDMESYSLLETQMRRGGLARSSGEKRRLSVRWSDANGNNLAEILEFQQSDSEEDDSDTCFCCIM